MCLQNCKTSRVWKYSVALRVLASYEYSNVNCVAFRPVCSRSVPCREVLQARSGRAPLNVTKYNLYLNDTTPLYCAFKDGAVTTKKQFMLFRRNQDMDDPKLAVGRLTLPYERLLWEVLELDEPLRIDHEVSA